MDNFAGGGGASTGIEKGTGRPPDIAINHDPAALWMHAVNHPETLHYCEDLGKLDPQAVTHGKPVKLAWFSPDCTHFSKAKGDTPVSNKIRGLAWCIPEWAASVKPELIMMENVREFLTWGPLMRRKVKNKKTGKMEFCWYPNPEKAGQTFKKWLRKIKSLGYRVEYKVLNAADYGAPTNRRRLFIIMRRDDKPIVWPEPTHGPGRLPYHTAAECIDWTIPCPSIFGRKRMHKPKTLDRVARGLVRYVLNNPKPFIVRLGQTGSNGGQVAPIDNPLTTIVSKQEHCLIDPFLVKVNHGGDHFRGQEVDDPLSTVTKMHGHALVTPHLQAAAGIVESGYGERKGQKPRVKKVEEPLNSVVGKQKHMVAAVHLQREFGKSTGQTVDQPAPTVMPNGGGKSAVVAAFLNKHYGGVIGQKLDHPVPTVTRKDHSSLTAVSLAKFRGDSAGQDVNKPMPTVTSGAGAKRPAGAAHALGMIAATLIKNNHGEPSSKPVDGPVPTITTQVNKTALAAANLVRFSQGEKQWNSVEDPLGTVTAQGNKAGLVYAFLTKHYSSGGQDQSCEDPLHTISTKDRFGVVTVQVDGETYVIVDIGLRMLQPRELATAQGFTLDYELTGSKANQVAKIGNSVPPPMVAALVRANWHD